MNGVNAIHIVGRIGHTLELRKTAAGQSVCTLRVSTQYRKKTTWHRVNLWDQIAEFAADRLGTGDIVYVAGRMEYRTYTANDNTERVSAEIEALTLQHLGSGDRASEGRTEPPADYPKDGNHF